MFMMPDKTKHTLAEQLFKACAMSALVGSIFYTNTAYATLNVPSLDTVLENISTQIPQLMQMVTALAYVMGFYFVIAGVMELKHVGESRTMMSSEHGLKKPLIFLFVGAALIYLPS